ncbi:MAG: YihY/virulence factor BrkB family protein [Acidobacteriota bacterium]
MPSVSNPEPATEPPAPETAAVLDVSDAPSPATSKWYILRHQGAALIRYLLDSEVHTFAFSVAANAILSFVPLVVMLYTLARRVFHSDAMVDVVKDMVSYFLPATTSRPDWLAENIFIYSDASHHGVQAISLVMILIACTGIFLPLEVALNQAWGVRKSRNYLKNQAVALGLAVIMVVLGMISMVLSAGQRKILDVLFLHHIDQGFFGWIYSVVSEGWLAICSGAACIVFFFFVYWLLPNCKVPARPVMRASVITGLVWLASRYIFVWILPHMDLKALYGPFFISVGLLFWAYISGLILFAGAQFSVARIKPIVE